MKAACVQSPFDARVRGRSTSFPEDPPRDIAVCLTLACAVENRTAVSSEILFASHKTRASNVP
jgi:hypothetical protein